MLRKMWSDGLYFQLSLVQWSPALADIAPDVCTPLISGSDFFLVPRVSSEEVSLYILFFIFNKNDVILAFLSTGEEVVS